MHDKSAQLALAGGSKRSHSFAITGQTPVASKELKKIGKDAILDAIWPAIEVANSGLLDYTRLRCELVVLAGSETGSVLRGLSLKFLATEIEGLWA